MTKITKRTFDGLWPEAGRDVFAWDAGLPGFGVRVKPSGSRNTSSSIGTRTGAPGASFADSTE